MMKTFRHFTMALAVLIMVGEVYRSIGDGRHVMFVLDDVFLGLAMFFSALFFTKDTLPKRAFFAASWGAAAGGVYGSFFSKLLACLLYTSPSPRDGLLSRMPSSA